MTQNYGILVAPDSFKGSLSATKFCDIAESVLRETLPGCRVIKRPMADGGEGTADALVTGCGGQIRRTRVEGPLGEPVDAEWGLIEHGRVAVVEMASASGLPLIAEEERDPLRASSYGTGQLIAAALDAGVDRIILGIGGSATNDGGAGALQALGFELRDEAGQALPRGAFALERLASVSSAQRHPRLSGIDLQIASDVTNPLLGERGATAVYGPQKGATPAQLARLETALERFAEIAVATFGQDHRNTPGAGAAGGMGFGFLTFCDASIRSGFELIAELFGIERLLAGGEVRLVITGEGEINHQTAQGKLVGRLAGMAAAHDIPVIALVGAISGDARALYAMGLHSISSIVNKPMTVRESMEHAGELLEHRLRDLARLLRAAGWCDPFAGVESQAITSGRHD